MPITKFKMAVKSLVAKAQRKQQYGLIIRSNHQYVAYFIRLPKGQPVPEIVNAVEVCMIPQKLSEEKFLNRVSILNRRRDNERKRRLKPA